MSRQPLISVIAANRAEGDVGDTLAQAHGDQAVVEDEGPLGLLDLLLLERPGAAAEGEDDASGRRGQDDRDQESQHVSSPSHPFRPRGFKDGMIPGGPCAVN